MNAQSLQIFICILLVRDHAYNSYEVKPQNYEGLPSTAIHNPTGIHYIFISRATRGNL